MRRWPLIAFTPLFLFAFRAPARAAASAGVTFSAGPHVTGAEVNGSADIGDDKEWNANADAAFQHNTSGTESRTRQFVFGGGYRWDPSWQGLAKLTFWRDTINLIHYAGPSFGFTYTAKEGTDRTPEGTVPITPITEKEKVAKGEARDLYSVTALMDIFFYSTEATSSPQTITTYNGHSRRFVSKTVPARTETVGLTQVHPNASIEVPLFDGEFIPQASVGHYFYSKDPVAIEDQAGQPRFAAISDQLNSMVGGFLRNEATIGFYAGLPFSMAMDTSLGAEQSATDGTWATTQGLGLSRNFTENLQLKLGWQRWIQAGDSSQVFSFGGTWTF